MADLTFNISKGTSAYYAGLPAASDAILIVPIENSGLETASTLKDYDTLSAALAGSSNEQTSNGTRKTAASVTVTIDDSNDRVDLDFADVTWTGLTGNALGQLWVVYDGDTGAGTDANILPLTAHDFAVTPDGSDVTASVANFARIS